MSNSKILSALLIGAAAGAALGVLFAPDKGSETRKKISKNTDDLINQLSANLEEGKTVLNDLKKKAAETKESIRSKVSDFMGEDETTASKKSRATGHSAN